MSESPDTVEIHDPDNHGHKKTIDRADYDPNVHTLWSEEHDAPAGPPMMEEANISPESLPNEPNAAVIEAPGSKAAQEIQRQRGQTPEQLEGEQHHRAEQEMERVEQIHRQAAEDEEKAKEAEHQRAADEDKAEDAN